LHWFLVQIIGDCVASPARDVTAMVMAIEREDQSTFGAKSSIRLQSDNWIKNLHCFLSNVSRQNATLQARQSTQASQIMIYY
jgi:L-serine deaminase